MNKETIWVKFACGGGARWTSVKREPFYDNAEGQVCNFSGCNCGTIVKNMGETTNRGESSAWFRRPAVKGGAQ